MEKQKRDGALDAIEWRILKNLLLLVFAYALGVMMSIGMQKLDDRVTKIELHLENVTDRNIKILAENYVPATKRFEEVTLQIPDMQCDIEVLKNVTAEHSILLGKIS